MEDFGFKIIETEKSLNMRPQIAEIATQLEASADNYLNALTDLSSEDRGVREEAIVYLGRQEEYLINAADTFVRMGFDTPEERDTEGAVRARLGSILEALDGVQS